MKAIQKMNIIHGKKKTLRERKHALRWSLWAKVKQVEGMKPASLDEARKIALRSYTLRKRLSVTSKISKHVCFSHALLVRVMGVREYFYCVGSLEGLYNLLRSDISFRIAGFRVVDLLSGEEVGISL